MRRTHGAGNPRSWFAALVLGVCFVLASSVAEKAHAADPVPFASATTSCEGVSPGHYVTEPVAQSRSSYLGRLVLTGSGWARWRLAILHYEYGSSGDVIWTVVDRENDVGNPIAGQVDCLDDSTFEGELTFYDIPTPPATFVGANTERDDIFNQRGTVAFNVPATGQYVADVVVQQGAVRLREGVRQQTFATTGTYHLGTVKKGQKSFYVEALDGPQAKWTVTVRALPVVISGLAVSEPIIRPGQAVTISYETSGDVELDANVIDQRGVVVRKLAEGLSVPNGKRSLTWDGLRPNGTPLPDGRYRIQLLTKDFHGNRGRHETSVEVDGGAPVITPAGSSVRPNSAFVVHLRDMMSGIRRASLSIDGGLPVDTINRWGVEPVGMRARLSYRPPTGWDKRSYRWQVEAEDNVGNKKTVSGRFWIRKGAGGTGGRSARVCGRLPGGGAYNYVRAVGTSCGTARRIGRKVRSRFCAARRDCAFIFPDGSVRSPRRKYRGAGRFGGWRCSVVVGWELTKVNCKKGRKSFRMAKGA
jgi:hypothetical protein